jgi:hypothetical protein
VARRLAPARVLRSSFRNILGWVEMRIFVEIRKDLPAGAGRQRLQPLYLWTGADSAASKAMQSATHLASRGSFGLGVGGGGSLERVRVEAWVSVPRCLCRLRIFERKAREVEVGSRTKFLEINFEISLLFLSAPRNTGKNNARFWIEPLAGAN